MRPKSSSGKNIQSLVIPLKPIASSVLLDGVADLFLNTDYADVLPKRGERKVKDYRRFSPAECTGIEKRQITGSPNIKYRYTRYVERKT
ncbi:MAG TPA: hypothetical protein VKG67_05440 [Gallionellaceae bacterium]|nr:hypothetical protein [Gallionellaceae bacterium]